jgi:hypothetical protein
VGVVYFDEEHKHTRHTPISGWLVRKGLAANQTSADLTLVVISALVIGLAIFVAQRSFDANQTVGAPAINQQIDQSNGPGPQH